MQNIVTLGEINDALKIAAVTAAQLADMGFAALANKPICEGLPPEESRRLRNAKLYPAESIGQIRVALAQRFAQPAAAADVPASGAAALSEYLENCEQHAIVPDVGGAFASAFASGFNLATSQAAPDERTDLVPGVMRCAKCEFQLVRQVLAVNQGEVFAGDSKTEPCPNGCGPLWPVTWKQYAEQAMDAAESMADRAFAAEKEVKQLRGELSALSTPNLRAKIMSTPLGLYGTGIGDIGTAYRAGHRAALLTAADLVASTVVAAPAAVAVPDDRAAFERELIDNHHYVPSDFSFKDGFYGGDDDYIQFGWDVWQARAALAATPAAEQIALTITNNFRDAGWSMPSIDEARVLEAVKSALSTSPAAVPVVLTEPAYKLRVNGVFQDPIPAAHAFGLPDGEHSLFTEQQVRALLAQAAIAAAPAHPAEGVQAVEQGEVLVTVSGFTGCGKSAIAGEIEIMCRALGLQVEWPDGDPEKNLTHADWTEALELYKPRVRIVECNVPHPFVKGQDK